MTTEEQARLDELDLAYLGLRFAALMASRALGNNLPHLAQTILKEALKDRHPAHLTEELPDE